MTHDVHCSQLTVISLLDQLTGCGMTRYSNSLYTMCQQSILLAMAHSKYSALWYMVRCNMGTTLRGAAQLELGITLASHHSHMQCAMVYDQVQYGHYTHSGAAQLWVMLQVNLDMTDHYMMDFCIWRTICLVPVRCISSILHMYTTDFAYDGPIFLVPLSLSYPSSPVQEFVLSFATFFLLHFSLTVTSHL